MNEMMSRAICIATEAHAHQKDRAGQSYILHPLRVMLAMKTDDERIVAVLHDVLEDCHDWTPDRLRAEGFSGTVLDGLDAVTKRDGESYHDFIARAKQNAIGRAVKVADLCDNSDLNRIGQSNMIEKDWDRHLKYARALSELA